ncbi:MAG TPA: sialidase [Bryobacteraceae bacterium]|nr:sialidase [Bryobacteraceae bacterium]
MRLKTVSLFLALTATLALAQRGRFGGPPEDGVRFRFLGPAVGNRIASVAGVPGDQFTYYAGAASGGVWKSTDGGIRFNPVFDGQSAQAIGALAVAPSDPKQVWAGTGEAWVIRDSDMMGNGIYKSSDAGSTWVHLGLEETGRIGRIIVHPTNPDIVFACAVGRATGPQQERGVYRTTDGGKRWERVLFVDENTGCSGLSMDAKNPNVLFAGTWQVVMHTWAMFSGGPSSGVWVSRDGGTKWSRIEGRGMPTSPVGKVDVAIAPTNSNRVYALIQTKDQGSLWRSDDAGENWRVASWDRGLIGRAGYYIHLAVSPGNENEVMVSNSAFHVSTDGGETFRNVGWGGDNHDIWIDPKNPDRFVITHDGGMNITEQHGRSFNRVTLPIGQMYHVAVDNQIPYMVYSNMQDNGTMRGVHTQPEATGRGGAAWEHGIGGCESGFTIPDPADPNIIWATCYGNQVTRYDARTKRARSVSPWLHTLDSPPTDTRYRCHWSPPLAIDPFDHNTVYYGCQMILRTTNGGMSWTEFSPDLSTKDPAHIVASGGVVGDNLGQFYGEVVFAIAPSPIQKGLIWAGTNDGKIWYTKDAGAHWVDVSPKGVPPLGTISKLDPSHFDAGTLYVALDLHMMDNRDPYILKTSDFGATWKQVQGDLPKGTLGYVRAVTEDPNKKGLLFAGTGNGFYYSLDDGGHWTNLNAGLPHAVVTWIEVQKNFRDVVISTYGRGLYVLDDITPLEQMAGGTPTTQLFTPRPTYRFSRNGRAYLNYSLKEAPKAPVQLEILDAKGEVIRQVRGAQARVGLNRASWDLRYESPRVVALRTVSPLNPKIWDEPRFRGAETRPVTHWGLAQAEVGPMAAPGKYSVKLTVDGQSFTQPFELMPDPNASSTVADLEALTRVQIRIRDDINTTSDIVNQLEWMRKQLEDLQKRARTQRADDLLKLVNDMETKMLAVETRLLEKAQMNSDDKYFVEAYKVYMNLIWLNGEIGTGAGDVAGGADFGPTETSLAMLQFIEKELEIAKTEYKSLLDKDVPVFNRALTDKGATPITTTAPAAATPTGRRTPRDN